MNQIDQIDPTIKTIRRLQEIKGLVDMYIAFDWEGLISWAKEHNCLPSVPGADNPANYTSQLSYDGDGRYVYPLRQALITACLEEWRQVKKNEDEIDELDEPILACGEPSVIALKYLQLLAEARLIMTDLLSWEEKYDYLFYLYAKKVRPLVGQLDYYDPDTSYQEDVEALYAAMKRKGREFWFEMLGSVMTYIFD